MLYYIILYYNMGPAELGYRELSLPMNFLYSLLSATADAAAAAAAAAAAVAATATVAAAAAAAASPSPNPNKIY